jgi:hypothetical protein
MKKETNEQIDARALQQMKEREGRRLKREEQERRRKAKPPEELRLSAERASKHALERVERPALMLRMIDVGFKILALEMHRDRGGSNEAMARLNKVRKVLRAAATR